MTLIKIDLLIDINKGCFSCDVLKIITPKPVPWTKQLRIGVYDDNFYMLHLNSIKKGKKSRKGNFTHAKVSKRLNVHSNTIKKARNTRGCFGLRAKNLSHCAILIIYFA